MVEPPILSTRRLVRDVAALISEVADWLAGRFSVCTVRGEISGFSRAASGHCYFTLKDADGGAALLRCAMFRRAASLMDFTPREGQLVEVRGRLGLYEARGELQLVVEAMRAAGAGALYELFLQLRARLDVQGLFDAGRKRALPPHPRRLGIVTSLGAAALHDVLTTLARRAPHVGVVVYPSAVQGPAAPQALVAALALASRRTEVDALILCRGGGSLEDLWAFNDEQVVRAVAAAAMPVVCGVGHETDVTLADLAADVRAATPTAAAELAAPARDTLVDVLDATLAQLRQRVGRTLEQHAQRLDRAAQRLARPAQALRGHRERQAMLAHRLASHWPLARQAQCARLAQADSDWRRGGARRLAEQRQQLDSLAARLRVLDPQQVLERGYAWLGDARGRPVTSVRDAPVGMALSAVLHDGTLEVQVTDARRRTSA